MEAAAQRGLSRERAGERGTGEVREREEEEEEEEDDEEVG